MREPLTVVATSDLHGCLLNPSEMPEGEVLCICGDIMPLDVQSDNVESIVWLCTKFFPWIESLPYEKVVMVWGNHDFIGQYLAKDRHGNHRKPSRVLKKLSAPKKLVLLEDNEFEYKGYRFYGSPWCPELVQWAFYGDSEHLARQFGKIPARVDVLLTHCPPRVEQYGMCLGGIWNRMTDYGCKELADAIRIKKPVLSIFGHVHTGLHSPQTINDTTYCNVSLKDEEYVAQYEPRTFKLI